MRMLLLSLALGAAACRGAGERGTTETAPAATAAPVPDPRSGGGIMGQPDALTYAPALGVNLAEMTKSPTGLYVKDVAPGSGPEATSGSTVAVHYTGRLADGNEFDSSRGKQPFSFRIDAGEVIAGWDEGVKGMKVGGKRLLVVPPQLGYGDAGAGGVIPPNATLVFEVELLAVR
jgi:peptidylprolyl isomerase